jgi:nitrogen fixation-related uncharacterized protein
MFPKFWLAFTALMLVAVAAVLWWAIRSGQFRRQDRARYLPLDGPPPEEKDPKKDEQGKLP